MSLIQQVSVGKDDGEEGANGRLFPMRLPRGWSAFGSFDAPIAVCFEPGLDRMGMMSRVLRNFFDTLPGIRQQDKPATFAKIRRGGILQAFSKEPGSSAESRYKQVFAFWRVESLLSRDILGNVL
jgi:hypothetical protein